MVVRCSQSFHRLALCVKKPDVGLPLCVESPVADMFRSAPCRNAHAEERHQHPLPQETSFHRDLRTKLCTVLRVENPSVTISRVVVIGADNISPRCPVLSWLPHPLCPSRASFFPHHLSRPSSSHEPGRDRTFALYGSILLVEALPYSRSVRSRTSCVFIDLQYISHVHSWTGLTVRSYHRHTVYPSPPVPIVKTHINGIKPYDRSLLRNALAYISFAVFDWLHPLEVVG